MIRVLVADDHPIVREGLRRLLAADGDMEVVGEAADGDEAMARCKEGVDTLLLDISMPGPGFVETLRRLRRDCPGVAVLVLSVYQEKDYAIPALRAGAAGYLSKNCRPAQLVQAIRQVYAGRKHVSPSLAGRLVHAIEPGKTSVPHETLSEREYEVFLMFVSGKPVRDIAADLSLSPKTVSTYRARIFKKMSVGSIAEMTRYAVRHGLVD